jgi:hypothetical protein
MNKTRSLAIFALFLSISAVYSQNPAVDKQVSTPPMKVALNASTPFNKLRKFISKNNIDPNVA